MAEPVSEPPPYPSPPPSGRDQLPPSGPGAPGSILARLGARLVDLLLIWFIPAAILLRPYLPKRAGDVVDLDSVPVWIPVTLALLPAVYEVILLGLTGQTVGKRLLHLRVARYSDGVQLSWYQAGIRVLLPLLPAALGVAIAAVAQVASALQVLVYATALIDPLWRGLHDRAAGTIVLRTQ